MTRFLLTLIRGRSNAEIARELFAGEGPVKTHVARVSASWGFETGLVTAALDGLTVRSARWRGPEGFRSAAG
jgi:hypothetical protein